MKQLETLQECGFSWRTWRFRDAEREQRYQDSLASAIPNVSRHTLVIALLVSIAMVGVHWLLQWDTAPVLLKVGELYFVSTM